MFRKSFKGFTVAFSLLVVAVLCVAIAKDEVDLYKKREVGIEKKIQEINRPSVLYGFLGWIADVRKNSPIPSDKIINQIMSEVNFENHSLYLVSGNKEPWDILDNWQRTELWRRGGKHVSTKEATEYYKDYLNTSVKFFFSFPWAYYLIKLLFVIGAGVVPILLSLLASLLSVKLSLSVVTACLLLLAITLRAQDNMIEFGTSTTGGKHNLSLFLLHMDKKTTGGGIFFEEGAWAWWGPLFNTKHGMILAPVGLTLGKGTNGLRAEHLSILTVAMFKFGKITPMLMGFFNQAIVKDKSSFGWAKAVVYYDFPGFMAGVRADIDLWKEGKIWRNALNIGPIVKFRKKLGEKSAFIFQVSGTFTRPYTLRTQWEVDF